MKTFLLLPAFLLSMFVLFGCGDSDADFELMKREMIASRIQFADGLPKYRERLARAEERLEADKSRGRADWIKQSQEDVEKAKKWVELGEKLRDESAEVRNLVASVEVYLIYKSLPSSALRKEFRKMANDPDIHGAEGKNRQAIMVQKYPELIDAISDDNGQLEKNAAAIAEKLNLKTSLSRLDYDSIETLRHAYDELRKLK